MSKFAVGEIVDSAADVQEGGTIVAVFPTVDGGFRYAVDTEGYGALQFFASLRRAGALTGRVDDPAALLLVV
jgi:hypothetical protein